MTAPITPSQGGGEHTPLPWSVEPDNHFGPGFVITAAGMGNRCPVVRMSSPLGKDDPTLRGDAELIVKACNSHATLKARIEELEAVLRGMVYEFEPFSSRPVGAPNSAMRSQQERQIGVHKRAIALLASKGGVK
jgi:hypothetical protein